ncbi:MAG: hypothetical protein D6761_00440 [Candidatus Dadabacteria bacterium]|nr:MAG: hypothetical protein D6761_00440 [Candidatus Dadabacteria bacterium]
MLRTTQCVLLAALLGVAGCLGDVTVDLDRMSGNSAVADEQQDEAQPDPWDETPPQVYFVIHADPATGPELRRRWDNLVSFMDTLAARRAANSVPHHVTIMFTPEWGKLIAEASPDGINRRKAIAAWVADGHEMAFHSHTHNHTFRDGYTNAPQFGLDVDQTDGTDLCSGDRSKGECSLDYGLSLVRDAIQMAVPGYDLKFGALGPRGNGGADIRWGKHDNSCDPDYAGDVTLADSDHCVQAEWSDALNAELEYVGIGFEQDAPLAATEALGQSSCVRYGAATTDIYALPFAPFETEAGQPMLAVTVMADAINMADARYLIGTVMHPMSYTGAATTTVWQLFDFLDGQSPLTDNVWGLTPSVTLSEARAADSYGPGAVCRDFR